MIKAIAGKFFNSGEQAQIALLGDEGAGKTTLMYHLKLSNWGRSMLDQLTEIRTIEQWTEDMGDMCTPIVTDDGEQVVIRDAGYHYEFFRKPYEYGLWDMPGNQCLEDLWISFYRSIQFHGVIFLVDPSNPKLDRSRVLLHRALYAAELRLAEMVIIINERKGKVYDREANEVYYKLELHQLNASTQSRLKVVVMDVTSLRGDTDKRWLDVLETIRKQAAKQGIKLG